MDLKRWKIFQKLDPVFAADIKLAYLIGMNSNQAVWKVEDGPSPYGGGVMVMKNGDFYSVMLNSDDVEHLGPEVCQPVLPLVPVKCDELCGLQIREISSGIDDVAILTAGGRVYRWGQNCTSRKPTVLSGILNSQEVIQITSGQGHSLALTQMGEVYSWGLNSHGQLGVGRTTKDHSVIDPVKVSGSNGFNQRVISVACGGWTSFALDSEGKVWSWGDHEDSALGYESAPSDDQWYSKRTLLGNIRKLAVGNTHGLALTTKHELYFWGQHTDEDPVVAPIKIKAKNVVGIGAVRGCTISAFKTFEGKIFFWGYAYGHKISDPVVTKFTSMEELFASLDTPVMLKPLEFEQRAPALVEKFKQNFDDKESCDVRFMVEGSAIYAHKAVLKIRSDYFRRMFDNNWKEGIDTEGVLHVTDFTYQGFRTFLMYLYTERIEPPLCNSEEAIELFKLGDYYGEEDLKQRCEQQLKLLTTKDNVCELYSMAVQYNVESLHDVAMDIIIPNLCSVVTSDGYNNMSDGLKVRLIQELAAEELFVGLKRKRKD